MLKFVAGLVVSLTLFAVPASPQTKIATVNIAEMQKMAAEREAMNNRSASVPEQNLEHNQIAQLVTDRQIQLRLDTEKLVALVAELKLHVDQTNTNVLSVDVIKKAQEIQKLAKSVQDKMRNAY